MTDRLMFARNPHDHGWQFGDVLTVVEDYGSAMSVRNARTCETATVLTSALEPIPASAMFRDEMMARVAGAMESLGHMAAGEFRGLGEDLAALALYEAMSEVSETTHCAAWLLNNGDMCWAWLQGQAPHGLEADWVYEVLATCKPTVIALANASQVWWADYDYAVPLLEWVDEHGEAPGVTVVRPVTS